MRPGELPKALLCSPSSCPPQFTHVHWVEAYRLGRWAPALAHQGPVLRLWNPRISLPAPASALFCRFCWFHFANPACTPTPDTSTEQSQVVDRGEGQARAWLQGRPCKAGPDLPSLLFPLTPPPLPLGHKCLHLEHSCSNKMALLHRTIFCGFLPFPHRNSLTPQYSSSPPPPLSA